MTAAAVLDPVVEAVRRSAEGVELELRIPEDLRYFQGHFPGFAILPGVVQVDWAIRLARRYLALSDAPAQSVRVKFHKPIRPNATVSLALTLSAEGRLSFACRDPQGPCASGQIGF